MAMLDRTSGRLRTLLYLPHAHAHTPRRTLPTELKVLDELFHTDHLNTPLKIDTKYVPDERNHVRCSNIHPHAPFG